MPNIKVKASLDRSDYDKGLESMKGAAKSLNNSLQGLGSVGGMIAGVFGGNLITGAFQKLTSAIRDAANEEVEFARQAENLGTGNTELHELVDTFEHFGGSLESVTGQFGKMAAAKAKFLAGDAKMGNAFAAMGISKQQAAAMSNMELYNAISARYSETRGAGDVGVAAGAIFGKGMNKPTNRRAMIAYGAGERYGAQIAGIDVDDANDEQATALRVFSDKASRAYKASKNLLARIVASYLALPNADNTQLTPEAQKALNTPGISWWEKQRIKMMQSSQQTNVEAEVKKQNVSRDEEKKQNAAAIKRAEAEAAQKKKDTDAENARYAKEQAEERIAGMNMHGPQADSYARRGLFAGGAPVDNAAYAIGRQQVQLARELLESSRRIESNLRHKETLQSIKNRGVQGEDIEAEPEAY